VRATLNKVPGCTAQQLAITLLYDTVFDLLSHRFCPPFQLYGSKAR
jgi:hypothetical protein